MGDSSNEDVVRRYRKAYGAHDYDTLASLRHRDWTLEWPQTGERIRGHANFRAAAEAYPGGAPDIGFPRLVGSEDRWALTPSFTLQRIVGNGDYWWGDGSIAYPDGSAWFFAVLIELRDGKVLRETEYFAPPSEAPAWRRPWVERIE